MIKFNSNTQNILVERGKIADNDSRNFIRGSLNLTNKKVEATKHSILSGPPGVGKSHGTMDECNKGGVNYLIIAPGSTDIEITVGLATKIHSLKDNEELVVILDDADDVVFGDYERMNKWKMAMAAPNYDTGVIPYFNHPVSIHNTITQAEKAGRTNVVEALKAYQAPGSLGVAIPTDRVRFVVLCNKDLEDPKVFGRRASMKDSLDAIMDRFEYKRLSMPWDIQWGWLAYTLSNSQPFEEYPLDDDSKKRLLSWMYDNWGNLRSTSYRMVRKLAASMINSPDNYEDEWRGNLKGH